jgi:hypothetical protein
VIVKLSSRNLTAPVFWLSLGPVQIDGTIDLNGDDGEAVPALAGAGDIPVELLQREASAQGRLL